MFCRFQRIASIMRILNKKTPAVSGRGFVSTYSRRGGPVRSYQL